MQRSSLTDTRRRALDKLLASYLEQPVEQQAAFLANCQQRWPRLSRWLEMLIERSQTVSLLDQSFTRLAGEALARGSDEPTRTLDAGHRLGPWQVSEDFREGGMGTVYRGERADGAFEMEVAIKLLKLRGHGLSEHLQQECRLLARVNHPGFTRLLDAGLDQQAGPFLVMEWVDGEDLSDWLASCGPGFEQKLDLFEQVVEAIGHAHQRLIVHGDIKPNNVRINPEDRAKVMDFGVARLANTQDQGKRMRALTPAFAAPEQLAGEPVTPDSDIWSLGALLFWLLTETTLPKDLDDLEASLSGKAIERPRELSALIGKACAAEPENRYHGCGELLDDLKRFRRHYPLRAMPDSRSYRLNRLIRRNPVLTGGIAATMIALTSGLVATTSLYLQADRAWQAAEVGQAQAHARAVELEQVAGFQANQLGLVNPEYLGAVTRQAVIDQYTEQATDGHSQAAGESEQINQFQASLADINFTDVALESLDKGVFTATLDGIDAQFADQPLVQARLLQAMAETQVHLGRRQAALNPQQRAYRIRSDELGRDHPDTLYSASHLGRLYLGLDEHDRGKRYLEPTLERQREVLGEQHSQTLRTLSAIGELHRLRQRHDKAEQTLRAELEGQESALGGAHADTLLTLNTLGLLMIHRGRPADAVEYLQQSAQGRRETLGEHHRDTLQSLNNLGITFSDLGQFEEAEETHRQVYASYSAMFGSDHPETLRSLSNLAVAIDRQGRPEEAETLHRRALEGRIRVLGEQHRDSYISMGHLALNLTSTGQLKEAGALYRRALAVAEDQHGPTHRKTLGAAFNLARNKKLSGNLAGAGRLSAENIAVVRAYMGEENWLTAAFKMVHARILKALADYPRASGTAASAYSILVDTLGKDHPRTLESAEFLVEVHTRWNERFGPHARLAEQIDHWRKHAVSDD